MKARDIVGKRVAKVMQTYVRDAGRPAYWNLDAIVFEDGTTLRFVIREGDAENGVAGIVGEGARGGRDGALRGAAL